MSLSPQSSYGFCDRCDSPHAIQDQPFCVNCGVVQSVVLVPSPALCSRPKFQISRVVLVRLVAALGIVTLVGTTTSMSVAANSVIQPQSALGSSTVVTESFDGADQYGVSVAISRSLSPHGAVPVVYLVSGVAYADALAAGPAAARDGGVILYTGSSSLPVAVANELVRLAPARVEVMGGTSTITDTVMSKVSALLAPSTIVERVSGPDAYGTAAALSARSFRANTGATFHARTPGRVLDSRLSLGARLFHSQVKQSFAVSGLFGIPAGAIAVTGNVTIVGQTHGGYVTVAPSLTSGVVPPTSTINFPVGDIRANGITVALGVGGKLDAMYSTGSTSDTVYIIFDVTGYFANDGAISHAAATVVVSSGENFSDAIAAGSASAMLDVPLLLVSHNTLPAATAAELDRLKPDRVIIVGNTTSVSSGVFAEISALVPKVERVSGTDSYATARAVAARFFPQARTVVATSGLTYTGGLAVIPLAAVRSAPILYLQDGDLLPVPTRDTLVSFRPSQIIIVGPISDLTLAELVGFSDGRLTVPTDTTAYPTYDSGYHDPGELLTIIKAEEIAYPWLVHVFSIGKSYQGRDIWAAKVSSDVSVDKDKPEVLIDALHHADEHLGVEQALYLMETLTAKYASDPLVHRLVNDRVIWIVFALNPDGWDYDLSGGKYHLWRKNRQPNPGSSYVGTDINRNYSYKWGCCGGSSATPSAWNYRGSAPFSTREAQALRNFVNSRVVNGKQRIRTQMTLHTNGELILYPYCYTKTVLPSDMATDDHAVFVTMARAMASMNGYSYRQSSYLYVTDGDEIDWLYHTYGIFSFTVELYPTDQRTVAADVYPPYSVVATQTARNRGALLYLIDAAACPYAVINKAAQYCSVTP